MLNGFKHNFVNFLLKIFCFSYGRPRIVFLIKIIPIHLIDSCSKDLLICWINSIFDHSVFVELVDVDCSCVSVVKDKRMAERLRFEVICLFACYGLKKLIVDRRRQNVIFSDVFFEFLVFLKQNRFVWETWVKRIHEILRYQQKINIIWNLLRRFWIRESHQ